MTRDSNRPPVATTMWLASCSFHAFHRMTPGMAGASRAELFRRLPGAMQAQAWAHLAREVEDER